MRRKRPDLMGPLSAGRKVELSTGLYTTNEPAAPGATHGGRPYAHVARDHRPDHLAILPDQRRACSLEDGCGVNNCACEAGWPGLALLARDLSVLANEFGYDEEVDELLAMPTVNWGPAGVMANARGRLPKGQNLRRLG